MFTIATVRDAVEFLLARSGYALAADEVHSIPARILLSHAIPQVQREVVYVSLSEALTMLAGDAYDVVLDPVHRRISFKLKEEYKVLYQASDYAFDEEELANVQQ